MKGINVYKKQAVSVSSNEELVLRLYEKAIVNMWEAYEHLEQGDKISTIKPLQMARTIFSELLTCLNHDEGGDISTNLHSLYVWMIREVSRSGFEGDPERLQKAINVAENLYDGFKQAFTPQENG